jgi:hypothetical protein
MRIRNMGIVKVYYTTLRMKLVWISFFVSLLLLIIFGWDIRVIIVMIICMIYMYIENRYFDRGC